MHPVEITKSLNFSPFSQRPFTRRLHLRYSGTYITVSQCGIEGCQVRPSLKSFCASVAGQGVRVIDNRALITRYLPVRSFRSPYRLLHLPPTVFYPRVPMDCEWIFLANLDPVRNSHNQFTPFYMIFQRSQTSLFAKKYMIRSPILATRRHSCNPYPLLHYYNVCLMCHDFIFRLQLMLLTCQKSIAQWLSC